MAIKTLGCKVNRTESEALAEALLGREHLLVDDAEGADLVVVNTCTVTGEADSKARKEVRRALSASAGPVVVTGCLAALDAEGLRAMDPRVVVEADRTALADRVGAILGAPRPAPVSDSTRLARPAGNEAFRTRVMLKVQDGCDHRCSYCIVPDARGVPRSVPANEVIERVRSLASAGTAEIVLTGINIGRYSDPVSGMAALPALLERLAGFGVPRLRISSIEPLDLTADFADVLRRCGARIAPHLHVPLQSGCDRTLAEMGRGYTVADFAEALGRVRAAVPALAVTTDVIVGFPGETDADFAESLSFVEECGFARLHVFRYSRRSGTPAAERSDQLRPEVIAERAARMRALSERLYRTWLSKRDGDCATVLVERVGTASASGTTEDGIRVSLTGLGLTEGLLLKAVLRSAPDGTMTADVETDGGGAG